MVSHYLHDEIRRGFELLNTSKFNNVRMKTVKVNFMMFESIYKQATTS